MPEYLTPGVYVEETSFRAKSIEGVSTSTTAFVGVTRRGPWNVTPPLLTSVGDFERIYGGLDDINGRPNYMAHAVRAYFENGGTRLYVSRVVPGSSQAARAPIPSSGTVSLLARFPGRGGNGTITWQEMTLPATQATLDQAPDGSLLRVGGAPGAPAIQTGTATAPFAVPNDSKLYVTANGTDFDITLHGEAAEVVAVSPLADPVTLDNTNNTLAVTIGSGAAQTITLPTGSVARIDVLDTINRGLRGGYARLDTGGHLVLGTDQQGRAAQISVSQNTQLGFNNPVSALGSANANNTVTDLQAVTIADIDALLASRAPRVHASASGGNALVLQTDPGASASLGIRDGAGSVAAALGLTPGTASSAAPSYYLKHAGAWQDNGGHTLGSLSATATADFMSLLVNTVDADGNQVIYQDLGFDPAHPRYVASVLPQTPTRLADFMENMFALTISGVDAFALRGALDATQTITLTNGSDGADPSLADYEAALGQLEPLEDISILAAPGYSAFEEDLYRGIQDAIIAQVSRPRAYQIAVLDSPPDLDVNGVRTERGYIDSTYAAMYYPWVVITNPLYRPGQDALDREITVPPSGFVCGIYARTDTERGVYKAPANEVVLGALRFERNINAAEQGVLNPLGINCLRTFPNRGNRIWGARTASSDPEWKYVNIRRYFNYLEHSIDNSMQWAVFEPNGERLWANVRDTVAAFLYNEWFNGALLGKTQDEAFFVKCDRSTMTQNDLDNGRLVCLVGVAALTPAEFVIFRIGQKTADARS